MRQYNVTAGCGHRITLRLSGPIEDHEQQLAPFRSATSKCVACDLLNRYDRGELREEYEEYDRQDRAIAREE